MPLYRAKRSPDSQDGLPFDASLRIKRKAANGADAVSIEDRQLNQGLDEATGVREHARRQPVGRLRRKGNDLAEGAGPRRAADHPVLSSSGPKSVTELENLLSARQAVVSQQLARLRL
jgi:hypothetical protein